MSTSALISVEEYLKQVYEPDAEYVDGEILERNVGEHDHSRLQMLVAAALYQLEKSHKLHVLPDQRVRVADTPLRKRYRIPDITVLCEPFEITRVLLQPPLAVVEILSPEDRMSVMLAKVADYSQFGIQYIFVVDPAERQLFLADSGGLKTVQDQILRFTTPSGDIAVDLKPLFADRTLSPSAARC